MEFGIRISSIRKKLNMNQKDFSDKLGMTQSNLSRIELGKQEPSLGVVEKTIEVFRINPTWIMTGSGSMFLDSVQNAQNLNHSQIKQGDSVQNEPNRNLELQIINNTLKDVVKTADFYRSVLEARGLLDDEGKPLRVTCPLCHVANKLDENRQIKVAHYAEGLLHEQMMEAEDKANQNAG